MEILSLTSRSFASGPAPLILPRCTGTRVCSDVRIPQGRHCAAPRKARRHRGWDLTPALDMHPPALEKKNGNSTSVPESLHAFTSSRSTAGRGDSVTPVRSPQARQRCCLPPLHHVPQSPCATAAQATAGSQDCLAGAAHALQLKFLPNGAWNRNNKEQLLVLWGLFKVKSRIANTSWKHCFLRAATSALCLVGSLGQKSNGKCKIRKPYHLGRARQYNIASAVMTMEKEQNAVKG